MSKVVTFGEMMLRLAPQGFLRFSQANNFDAIYGGGESNVAVSLANYDVDVDFVTRLPQNDIGECAMMEIRKRGVGVDKIVYGGVSPTEENLKGWFDAGVTRVGMGSQLISKEIITN